LLLRHIARVIESWKVFVKFVRGQRHIQFAA
jgi:hypothetical protein